MRLLPLVALACLGLACGEDAPVSAPVTTPEEPPASIEETTPQVAFDWETCPFETGGTDRRAECADIEVPLDWNAPEGKKVAIFVKRLLGNAEGPRQQLWLLSGGPGAAGDSLEPYADEIARRDDAVDIYLPDHRGTGRSAYLDCPDTFKYVGFDAESCAVEAEKKWGKGSLATFSTTTAARDVGYVIENTRAKDQGVHVYGVSYGTYWAQRYLQLFPKQPTAVTLDSVCQAGICSMAKYAYWTDRVGRKYLAECGADAFCASKLGADPEVTVREAIARAEAGTCSGIAGIDASYLRMLYSWFITSFELRVLIPATAYRIARCNEEDVEVLTTFVDVLRQMTGGGGGGGPSAFATENLSSSVLQLNIGLSELEEDPYPTPAEVSTLMEGSIFSEAQPEALELYQQWPRYARDAFVGKYPESTVPVLLMNGTLDPQTPQEFADQVAPHYDAPNQSYVLFPRAAHGVIVQSPTGAPPAEPCGTTVWKQFVANPTAPLDTSCTARILPHDFESSPRIAQFFFKRPSLWSAASFASAPNAPPPITPEASRAIAGELRRAQREVTLASLPQRLRARALAR